MLNERHRPLSVSVVIPVYNGAATLRRAIRSALLQTGCILEVIVVDDGSTDLTPEILREFQGQVRTVRQSNAGVGAARNKGLDLATGQYIAFLDADDEWLPGKLEKQLAALARFPNADLVYCGAIYRTADGLHRDLSPVFVEGHDVLDRLALGNFIATSSLLARADCFRSPNARFATNLRFGEDYTLWLQFAIAGCTFSAVHESLVLYAVGEDNYKYSVDDHLRLFGHVETMLQSAPGLSRLRRARLLRRRRSSNAWSLATLFARNGQWSAAFRQAIDAWRRNPLALRGIGHFFRYGLMARH
jgi:glycosyltransferase involved in cell wall biosynthesis